MGAVMREKFRGATRILGGPGVLNMASSCSSREASRALRFRRVESGAEVVAPPPRLRVDMCDGVSADPSSSMASTEFARSDLIRLPVCDSLSAAIVSVCERMDWLLLRSRTEPPARDDAILPGLVRFAGAFRLDRPERVSGSSMDSSSGSSGCFVLGGVSVSAMESCSGSFPFPFALDLRCAFAFGGLCFIRMSGGTSSRGSTSGRGLAGMAGASPRLERFQRVLADTGVPSELTGERGFVGVETECLA